MAKQLSKQVFGTPSTGSRSATDMVSALGAAHCRLTARLRKLERQFEEKASELRSSYLIECAAIQGD